MNPVLEFLQTHDAYSFDEGVDILLRYSANVGVNTFIVRRRDKGHLHAELVRLAHMPRLKDLRPTTPKQPEKSAKLQPVEAEASDADEDTFEYYLSATSNNGKTITKPMTAAQGGYYTFYIGENVPVSINTVSVEEAFGQFFPNPSSEQAHIQIEMSESHPIDINIVDLTGRTIYHSTIQPEGDIIYTLNTNRLAKGVYSVVFSSPEGQVVRRLVIE